MKTTQTEKNPDQVNRGNQALQPASEASKQLPTANIRYPYIGEVITRTGQQHMVPCLVRTEHNTRPNGIPVETIRPVVLGETTDELPLQFVRFHAYLSRDFGYFVCPEILYKSLSDNSNLQISLEPIFSLEPGAYIAISFNENEFSFGWDYTDDFNDVDLEYASFLEDLDNALSPLVTLDAQRCTERTESISLNRQPTLETHDQRSCDE